MLHLLLLVSTVWAQTRLTAYNETLAKQLLNLSAGAYGTEQQQCLSRTYPPQFGAVATTETQQCDELNSTCGGYVVVSDSTQELIVVFRGTKTDTQLLLEGWATVNSKTDFYGMGKVNTYFKNAHEILWPAIQNVITQPQYANYGITFTGHSLGAALAALGAARTATQLIRPGNQIKLIDFGEPRVGDLDFAQSFDAAISYSYRVVFRHDIVPHLPACHKQGNALNGLLDDKSRPCDPTSLNHSYHHGTEIWYPTSMAPGSNYVECLGQPKNEDFSCSDGFKFEATDSDAYIWDHRHYFQVEVPDFGEAGCDPQYPDGLPKPNSKNNNQKQYST